MKLKLSLLFTLLCIGTAWCSIPPEQAAAMRLKAEMEFFDIESVRQAYNDFSKTPLYDTARYGALMKELEQAAKSGNEEQIVKLKREILLSNPLLDNAKVIVGRYRIGSKARSVMAPSLGTQNNNWSNQSSSARKGFDAEIAELERRNEKRQMTLERVNRREKRHMLRNREDREDHRRNMNPHRRQYYSD